MKANSKQSDLDDWRVSWQRDLTYLIGEVGEPCDYSAPLKDAASMVIDQCSVAPEQECSEKRSNRGL